VRSHSPWACPSCRFIESADGHYCRRCGEERLGATVPGALGRRWWRTLRLLVLQPGQLTRDHNRGRRKFLVPPLALFLALNLVFFIAQSLSGFSVLSVPLQAHLEGQPYSESARETLVQRLLVTGLGRERFEDRFDHQQQTLAKASVITMVPLWALVCAAVAYGRRERYGTHLAFGLHLYAFLLLFSSAFYAAMSAVMWSLSIAGIAGIDVAAPVIDTAAGTVVLVVTAGYLWLACGKVFGESTLPRAAAVLALSTAVVVLLFVHRFAVFVLTALSV
jgi:hypothetical protein